MPTTRETDLRTNTDERGAPPRDDEPDQMDSFDIVA